MSRRMNRTGVVYDSEFDWIGEKREKAMSVRPAEV
jgi:hypothetical protein